MRLPSRPILIIIGAVLLLALVGGGYMLLAKSGGKTLNAAQVSASPSPTNTLLYTNAAPEVAKTIKRLPEAPKEVLSTDAYAKYGKDIQKAIPAGSTLEPKLKTWKPDGVGGGAMVTVLKRADGTQQAFIVIMIKQGGQWKIETTYSNSDGSK